MEPELTIEQLSEVAQETVERLRELRSLGLIGKEGSEGFASEDVDRVRVVQLSLRSGVPLDVFVRMAREEGSVLHTFLSNVQRTYLKRSIGQEGSQLRCTLEEAAERTGIELPVVQQITKAAGLGEPGIYLDGDELDLLAKVKLALDAGFSVDAIIQIVRVYGDALGRIAEAEQRLFHSYIHERLRAQGLSHAELTEASNLAGDQLYALVEPTLLLVHRRSLDRAAREDIVTHVLGDAGLLEEEHVPGQLRVAVVFVDLASFTPLAAAMGDVAAAEVVGRFSGLVRDAVARHQGRLVKHIGDAFMLVFADPRSALVCALDIEAQTDSEPQFPALRSGIQWGDVLYREGDYVGTTVNIASRLAGDAARHQVLVTAAVRKEARELAGVEFVPVGKRSLRGLAEEIELFEARSTEAHERGKAIDPVCGMELRPAEVVATLTRDGRNLAFCSEECLSRFVAAPAKFG